MTAMASDPTVTHQDSPKIWGIADLHLSHARPDSRDRFAGRWKAHVATIAGHWRRAIGPGDLVLMPGDISMARNHRDLQPDLNWLENLPGTKVLAAGNHDVWFNRASAIRPMLRRDQLIVGGDAVATHGVIVCGALGAETVWEDDPGVTEKVLDRQERELDSVDAAIRQAFGMRTADEPVYVLWHYPPFDLRGRPGPAAELFEEWGVTACIYGHVHTQGQWSTAKQGEHGGVRYHCVAADAIGFQPIRVDRVVRAGR